MRQSPFSPTSSRLVLRHKIKTRKREKEKEPKRKGGGDGVGGGGGIEAVRKNQVQQQLTYILPFAYVFGRKLTFRLLRGR